MKKGVFTLIENTELVPGMHRLTFSGDGSGIVPGQFAEVSVPGYFLRRPFSVAGFDEGTAALCAMEPGARLDILTCLGNGFDLSLAGSRPLLIGGGSGVGVLMPLCRALTEAGAEVSAALGFGSAAESFCVNDFVALGATTAVYTADGSLGRRGLVTEALRDFEYSSVYACGAVPMLQIIDREAKAPAQFSLEARMGCGFGACMGCTVETVNGPKRVCKDGPVFGRGELVW